MVINCLLIILKKKETEKVLPQSHHTLLYLVAWQILLKVYCVPDTAVSTSHVLTHSTGFRFLYFYPSCVLQLACTSSQEPTVHISLQVYAQ